MFYHLSLQMSPDASEAFRRNIERDRELRRAARQARSQANKALGKALIGAAAGAVGRVLRSQIEAASRRRQEAATIRELQALSDRALADIGLTRRDIPDIARTLTAARRSGAAGVPLPAVPHVAPHWRPQLHLVRGGAKAVPAATPSLAAAAAGGGELRDCA
jgi:uncharacterized protein YjiS (DUF1127 family)